MTSLRAGIAAGAHPAFAILNRHGNPHLEVLVGSVVDVDLLSAIPLLNEQGQPNDVLALVPFGQIRERGYMTRDDDSPLRCLVVEHREHVAIEDLHALAGAPPELDAEQGFDVGDADYAEVVKRIIADEIGAGEGSNFVIRREFQAHISEPVHNAVLAWLAALMSHELGAEWTFAVCTPGLSMVGASPEQHLSVVPTGVRGQSHVRMNPIAGTYRHPIGGASADGLLDFLSSAKECEELFMVVDEELKMMSRICSSELQVRGPFLKQMAHLTHTEYLIEGVTQMRPLDALRLSMFAPTITGSPMQNACAVIAKYEPTGRGYYAGALAFFEQCGKGEHSLDAPILIRTAYVNGDGDIRVPVGATLVRHSDPHGEVAETHAKSIGVLQAIGARANSARPPQLELRMTAAIDTALRERNSGLSGYWLSSDGCHETLMGRAMVIDAEDDFSAMLVHQLRALGMSVTLQPWSHEKITECDLLVAGPGPGDPSDLGDERIARMHEVIRSRRESGGALLAVCLSHQILAAQLGLGLQRLGAPRQGLVLEANVLGIPLRLGHYNTFSAFVDGEHLLPAAVSVYAEADSSAISSMSGTAFASVQGHPESVLSGDGLRALRLLAMHAMR